MGETIGFICYNCGYEERYPDEVGIKAAAEKESFQCEECQTITINPKGIRKCGKCKSTNVKEMQDSTLVFICPACNDHVFE